MYDIKQLPKIILLPIGKDVIKEAESVLGKIYENKYLTDYENYIYFENTNSTSLLQAHVDTVKREDKFELYVRNEVIFAEKSALGADDRAGVFAIFRLVTICLENKIPIPNVLLTNYEESGSGGMRNFIKNVTKEMFGHINMAIAMDRKGCGHYVTYNTLAKEVENYMYSFGWAEQHGSFSDISLFTEAFLIPSVNVSIGYHSEHTKNESLNVDELFLAIGRVNKMLKKPIKQRYEYVKKVYEWKGYNYKEQIAFWNNKDKEDKKINKTVRYWGKCDFCQQQKMVQWCSQVKQSFCDKCYEDWFYTINS